MTKTEHVMTLIRTAAAQVEAAMDILETIDDDTETFGSPELPTPSLRAQGRLSCAAEILEAMLVEADAIKMCSERLANALSSFGVNDELADKLLGGHDE